MKIHATVLLLLVATRIPFGATGFPERAMSSAPVATALNPCIGCALQPVALDANGLSRRFPFTSRSAMRRLGCKGAHDDANSACASKRCIGVEHTGFHYQIVGVQDASGNIGGLPDAGAIINGLRARVMILGPCSVEGTCA